MYLNIEAKKNQEYLNLTVFYIIFRGFIYVNDAKTELKMTENLILSKLYQKLNTQKDYDADLI